MVATMTTAELPFILSTGRRQGDAATRKLIRSHVMLGKNKGKPRPTKRGKQLPWETVPSWSFCEDMEEVQQHFSVVPKRVGSDWSFIQLADEIEPATLSEILEVTSVVKQASIPLQACIVFHKNVGGLVEPLVSDAAYLHAAALGSHIYIGLMLDKAPAFDGSSPHYPKALRLLRERLSSTDESEKISDSTIIVVIVLALHARITGDYDVARHHMEGLLKMADLRGGIASVSNRTMLAMSIFRTDIGIALESNSKPVFFAKTSIDGSFMSFPEEISMLKPEICDSSRLQNRSEVFLEGIDEELTKVWKAMKRFCVVINEAAKLKHKFPEATLLQAMASFMYRLLHSSFAAKSVEEAFRLALLAFCSQAFLQLPSLKIQDTTLPGTYRECLVNIVPSARVSPNVVLWLQMVGAVSVFRAADAIWLKPLLRSSIEKCGIGSWSDMADTMNSYIWIGLLFDEPGREVFTSMLLR